jgi:hypothetical protein
MRPVPEELINRPREQVVPSGRVAPPPPGSGRSSSYGVAALEAETHTVAHAVQGTRNETLHLASFRMGQLVAGGALDASTAMAHVLHAGLACGLPEREVRRTMASGFKAGYAHPRSGPR